MSTLDRSVPLVLPNPDDTASRKPVPPNESISAADERIHRLHGTGIIHDVWTILRSHPRGANGLALVDATACVIFHRFFHAVSLYEADVWSIAMASMLIASKIHTVTMPVRDLVLASVHVYRKRTRLIVKSSILSDAMEIKLRQHDAVALSSVVSQQDRPTRHSQLRTDALVLSQTGPVWKIWHEAVVQAEARVLRQLGFIFYWIPDSHPHWYAPPFVEALCRNPDDADTESTFQTKALLNAALEYCHLASRLDLCLRFDSAVVCCAAIWCAQRPPAFHSTPTTGHVATTQPNWWHVLCSNEYYASRPPHELDQDVWNAANALWGLVDPTNLDVLVAHHAYIKSKVRGQTENGSGSFNDPGSFIWEMLVEPPSD